VTLSRPQEAEAIFRKGLKEITRYVDILASRGIEWGLLGPREADRIWDRHVLNSTAVLEFIPDGARVADIGSGAGLPGIPIAIARPDVQVTLVESLLRRADFLSGVVTELGLDDRVQVVRARAEDLSGFFEVVTARAVARLPKLIDWTRHLFVQHGELLAIKGSSVVDEVADATSALDRDRLLAEVLDVWVPGSAEPTYVVRVRPRRFT
jgi:16S rRNA (guanine527-N7)-methyltransferase